MLAEASAIAHHMVGKAQPPNLTPEQGSQPLLALDQRQLGCALTVQEQQIERQPLSAWSGQDVWNYIRAHHLPVAAHYQRAFRAKSPECARCPASWEEGRARYLRAHHPGLARDYKAELEAHLAEVRPALDRLTSELRGLE
jgi:3'-phosphoadenosine 5'-phosphosulfate sulfotransferase (PAPS reductase)/FAD synthetase